jgi:twitching motility protein PilT
MEPKPSSDKIPVARPVATPQAIPTAVPAVAVAQAVQVVEQAPAHTLAHVDEYLRKGQESDASDIHLAVNARPSWRRFGILEPIWLKADLMNAQDTERLALGFLNEAQRKRLFEIGDVDFAYATNFGRFRASVVRHRLGIDMSFRIISTKMRSMDDLGLPDSLKMLTQYNNGLILVTGSVGSGKSTTLAAMVDYVNETRHDHIITLEDPVEYVIPSRNCHVTQREVHTHTKGFAQALRGALREDPDVIMVGEMRDLETIQLAITASETGHLVLATLHTGSAARTLDRVLDVFPADQREQIRVMVSESLRGIVSQQLVPRANHGGRVLALEILLRTEAVAACIRDGKTFMLPGVMQTGGKMGMRLMDDSLLELYRDGIITEDECYQRSEQKVVMRQQLLAHK